MLKLEVNTHVQHTCKEGSCLLLWSKIAWICWESNLIWSLYFLFCYKKFSQIILRALDWSLVLWLVQIVLNLRLAAQRPFELTMDNAERYLRLSSQVLTAVLGNMTAFQALENWPAFMAACSILCHITAIYLFAENGVCFWFSTKVPHSEQWVHLATVVFV